ncbi:unnamed protein product [Rhizophagus irregularis]|nr:unnamed protein product [Rhizophagus irregularis]
MSQDYTSPVKTTKALDEYVLLGRSGLRISPLCLGTVTFGEQWIPSNIYNYGESERFLGDYVSDKRSNVVIATKYTTNRTALLKDQKFNPNFGELALYIAVSDISIWALARANTMAELRGWEVGVIPWGTIAEGFLTGKYTRESTVDPKLNIHEVIAISEEIDRSPVQVALNWVQQKPGITSSLIGARTVSQLEENLRSLEFKLTPEQMKRLDDVSKPNEVPFPHKFSNQYDGYLGKNIQVPNKFAPIVKAYNYGSLY